MARARFHPKRLRRRLPGDHGRGWVRAAGAAILLAACSPVLAQSVVEADPANVRLGASLGFDVWSDLGDLRPDLGGSFDDAGIAIEASAQAGGWALGPARLFAGLDVGILGNGSDVEGVEEGEDLQATLIYIAPSLKAVFGAGGRFGWWLDAGIGYYDVAIDEWEDDCFWDCDVFEYYDDSSIGGFLGLGVEFPLADRSLRLVGSARIHFVEFDEPRELTPVGSLDGPIYVLSIGVAYYR